MSMQYGGDVDRREYQALASVEERIAVVERLLILVITARAGGTEARVFKVRAAVDRVRVGIAQLEGEPVSEALLYASLDRVIVRRGLGTDRTEGGKVGAARCRIH